MFSKKEKKMMTLKEIQYCKNINEEIVKEALAQVKERLKDVLDAKDSIEQRAFVLFNGATSLLLAEISAAYVVRTTYPEAFTALKTMIPYSFAGVVFLVLTMIGFKYGGLGSDPISWLQDGTLNAKKKNLKALLAYQVFYHYDKIETSKRSNSIKVWLTRLAILSIVIGAWVSAQKLL